MQEVTKSRMSTDDNERQIDEYLARKSRYVSSKEFEGDGKVLVFNSVKVNPQAQGKYGPVIEYTVKDPNTGIERAVNASAVSLIRSLRERLKEKPSGTDVPLLVKKSGVGADTRYVTAHAKLN
jgi:hypothetical protein